MIPVILWTNHDGVSAADQWDFGLLRLMFEGKVWTMPHEFSIREHHYTGAGPFLTPEEHETGRAIFVVPARHHVAATDVAALNDEISLFPGVLIMLIGDEEADFPWREIVHPNAAFWVMHPDPIKHADMWEWAYFFGTGFRYDTPELLKTAEMPAKTIPWVFAGQVTHLIRKQCANALRKLKERRPGGVLVETEGFTQGLPRNVYLDTLVDSRVAFCPSGPATPDTFRFYEALEAGCLPIVDWGTRQNVVHGDYWTMVYGRTDGNMFGFISIHEWGGDWADKWPPDHDHRLAQSSAWWQQTKRGMVKRLIADLERIGVRHVPSPPMTVVVTTSPIPSNPSMHFLQETLDSIWAEVGHVETIIVCDGARPEQDGIRDAYYEYVRNVTWHCEHVWPNVLPIVLPWHCHQAEAVRQALHHVDTPVILFSEHDTPFSGEPIDWSRCISMMEYGALDVLRFSHEAAIHPEHQHLFLDREPVGIMGVPVMRTVQWSQRPHLARTAYYREIMERFFPLSASCHIEDRMYSVAQSDRSMVHRLAVYHPAGSIRRTLHSDGREGADKFDRLQRFQ